MLVNKKKAIGSMEKIKSRIAFLSKKVSEGDEKEKAEFDALCAQEAELRIKYQPSYRFSTQIKRNNTMSKDIEVLYQTQWTNLIESH
ncbi:hypothetical protein [Candidatus Liberibacter sp.]|uniref:hypothetical protein n=1 Tax=Candidatus Liberibacter sp. TaxID=34022 RepID=UPI0015F4F26F|nr:hypothetical protein [Candidatus Liberibacter sp.]MBA5724395.1 hypothetical protein [Candidatus Liberibacter sp.]